MLKHAPNLITIGVTGSTGISTTSRLIAHMLETLQQACQIITAPASDTPQNAFKIHARKLTDLADSNVQVAIQEVTSEQLASRFFDTFSLILSAVCLFLSLQNHSDWRSPSKNKQALRDDKKKRGKRPDP